MVDLHAVTTSRVLDDLAAGDFTELNLSLEDIEEVVGALQTRKMGPGRRVPQLIEAEGKSTGADSHRGDDFDGNLVVDGLDGLDTTDRLRRLVLNGLEVSKGGAPPCEDRVTGTTNSDVAKCHFLDSFSFLC